MAASSNLPDPPVPPDADLRDFAFTPIYRARLFGSAFHARASDAEWRAGVTLWLKSQDQVPAGSLPKDDVELCRLAELGRDMKGWRKIRAMALHGWFECSDGRLYNAVTAEIANEQWNARQQHVAKRERWREKKARQRGDVTKMSQGTDGDVPPGQRHVVLRDIGNCPGGQHALSEGTDGAVPLENALKGQGQGQGQERKKEILPSQPCSVAAARAPLPPPRAGDEAAIAVVAAFDASITEHFGQSRRGRGREDIPLARSWLERGVGVDRLAAVLDEAVGRYAIRRPGDMPQSLKLFAGDVDHAEPPSMYPPTVVTEEDRMWYDRATAWTIKGAWLPRNGPPPDDPETRVPDHVLAARGLTRRRTPTAARRSP